MYIRGHETRQDAHRRFPDHAIGRTQNKKSIFSKAANTQSGRTLPLFPSKPSDPFIDYVAVFGLTYYVPEKTLLVHVEWGC